MHHTSVPFHIDRIQQAPLGASAAKPSPCRVLFVDDDEQVRSTLNRLLRAARVPWECEFAANVDAALSAAHARAPDVVVTDVHMPGRDGFALLDELQRHPTLRWVPVIVVTGSADSAAKRRALDLGAIDLLCKPVSAEDLIARVSSAIRIKASEDSLRQQATQLDEMVTVRTRQLETAQLEAIMRLATAGEYRDSDTGLHVVRVGNIARVIGAALGMNSHSCERLFIASMLHDIGKVGVPDGILRKTGPFTPEERVVMQTHCQIGHSILCGRSHPGAMYLKGSDSTATDVPLANEWLEVAGTIALHHHERWDGAGYPAKLRAEEIPAEARIVAVADVIDALSSERPYKRALAMPNVREMIREVGGSHLAPDVVEMAMKRWAEICDICQKCRECGTAERAAA